MFLKSILKKSVLIGLGGFAAVVLTCLLVSHNSSIRETGLFYVIFAAAFLLLNSLLYLPYSKFKRRAAKITAVVVICVVNLVLAFGVSVYYLQGKMLFEPNNSVEAFRQIKSEKSFESVDVTAKDGTKLTGWMKYNAATKRAPLLIYFGGNGQNSSKAFSNFEKQGTFQKLAGYNVMMVDYRSYGYSEGKPSDEKMFSDALDIYDQAAKQPYTDPWRVAVMGYSIGTGPATYLASQRPAAGLILVAPYYNGERLYNGMMDIFHGPLTALIRYQFDTERYAPQVKCSPLIFTSKKDKMIDWRQSEALSKRFPKIAGFEFVDGATHETYFGKKKMFDDIQSYLKKIGDASK